MKLEAMKEKKNKWEGKNFTGAQQIWHHVHASYN
jgi:hypothetical protein